MQPPDRSAATPAPPFEERWKRGKEAVRDALNGMPLSPERREWALDFIDSATLLREAP